MYTKKCSDCGIILNYKNKKSLSKSIRNNSKCRKCSVKGESNSMYGKTVYEIWLNKHGKIEADIRMQKLKNRRKELTSGKNNPMYGKPSPNGSGNGWKGWYKGIYFRSLRELIFMIKCDEWNISYENAEFIKIPYLDVLNNDRTCRPDFICNNTIIEIKPIRLHNSPNNLLKFEAIKKHCLNNNLRFKLIDVKINADLIKKNLINIKFNKDYLERFLKWND